MVDAGIEAELACDEAALLRPAGDPDRAASLDLGDLPDHRADRARGGRHHDGLAGLGLADLEQSHIGSHARHAENAERGRDRRRRRIELAQPSAARQRVVLPAAIAEHDVAGRVARMARLDDLADRAADHRRPDGGRLGIGFRGAHAAAHVGVERQIARAHQQLALAGLGDRRLGELEIVEAGRALRPALQQDLAVGSRSHRRSPSVATTMMD